MPRARVSKLVSDDGTTKVIERETAAGGKEGGTVTARFEIPSNATKWQEAVLAMQGDGLETAYAMYCSAIERKACLDMYTSVAQESTEISVPGVGKVDLMTFPLAKLVKAINRKREDRSDKLTLAGVVDEADSKFADLVSKIDRSERFGPWRTAAAKLIEAGKASENADGLLVATA